MESDRIGAGNRPDPAAVLTMQTNLRKGDLSSPGIPVSVLAGIVALVIAGCGSSPETGTVNAYPSPGTPTASKDTRITLVGLDIDDPGEIKVVGSKSGEHKGELKPLGSVEGVSFIPDEPFQQQEEVTVTTDREISGGEGNSYSFQTASFRTDAALPPRVLPPESRTIKHQNLRSRPDLKPPVVKIEKPATDEVEDNYLFISPKVDGPMIIRNDGQLVYFRPSTEAADFRPQTMNGEPVITWWEGPFNAGGYTEGTFVIADEEYREVKRVRAGNGYKGDLHEFKLTDRGTAYATIYRTVKMDLSKWGGPKNGAVLDSVAQEIDLGTGKVLWEWHSIGNVGLNETYIQFPQSPTEAFDYFHINSIEEDDDGDILISGRNTFSVVKVKKDTGEIIWRLGGKKSDFEMGEGTDFSWQHDALRQPDGTITVYDNAGNYFGEPTYDHSRGLVLDVDEEEMTAELAEEPYVHPDRLLAPSQGNLQITDNGNRLVGWGSQPWFTEYTPDGEVQLNGTYFARNSSYRTYRGDWTGKPTDRPAVATRPAGNGATVWVSWNGATEVTDWRVRTGPDAGNLAEAVTVPMADFETGIKVGKADTLIAVEALDASGEVIGRSAAVEVGERAGPGRSGP